MGEEDPFSVVADLSRVSSSQESLFRGCRLFWHVQAPASSSSSLEEDENRRNSADIPGGSTPIIMESLRESPGNGNTDLEDLFHTPSEGSLSSHRGEDDQTLEEGRSRVEGTAPVDSNCAESLPAVDLGRDTDLGFSEEEVQLTQRIEVDLNRNAALQIAPDEARVSKRRLSPAERLEGEPPSKRLEISETVEVISREEFSKSRTTSRSPRGVSASVTGKDRNFPEEPENQRNSRSRSEVREESHTSKVTLMNSPNKLKGNSPISALRIGSEIVADEIRDSSEKSEPKKQQNDPSSSEFFRGRPDKKPINFSTEVVEKRNAENGTEVTSGGGKKGIEDICKFAFTGPEDPKLRETEKEARGKRVLPPSIATIMEVAKSLINPSTRAEAPASSNATQGAATSETNVIRGTARNESDQILKLKALADVLMAFAKHDQNDEDLSSLSLMDIARRRGSIVTPSWWPPGGF